MVYTTGLCTCKLRTGFFCQVSCFAVIRVTHNAKLRTILLIIMIDTKSNSNTTTERKCKKYFQMLYTHIIFSGSGNNKKNQTNKQTYNDIGKHKQRHENYFPHIVLY